MLGLVARCGGVIRRGQIRIPDEMRGRSRCARDSSLTPCRERLLANLLMAACRVSNAPGQQLASALAVASVDSDLRPRAADPPGVHVKLPRGRLGKGSGAGCLTSIDGGAGP
jgi:hypothetical protein